MAQLPSTHKFGWLLNRFGLAVAVCLAAVALSASPAKSPALAQVISAHGEWAALKFGERCEARTRGVRVRRGKPSALAGFAFGPSGQGQFYARLSRAARPGSTAILTIGGQPFLLAVRGDWAWGRDYRQDKAILGAARYAGSMRIESRDSGGRRFIDRFLLGGAASAADAAAATCAQAGKSR